MIPKDPMHSPECKAYTKEHGSCFGCPSEIECDAKVKTTMKLLAMRCKANGKGCFMVQQLNAGKFEVKETEDKLSK